MKHIDGFVIKSTGSWNSVKTSEGEIVECKVRGKFRIKGIRNTNPVAVGDHVYFDRNQDGTGVITELVPRKNYIIRKATNLSREAHIMAANIDQAFLLVTLEQPKTSLMFIDRFLVSAEAYRIPVVLLINKIDVYDDDTKELADVYKYIYDSIGYKTHEISVKNGDNVELVKEIMKDSVSVFVGLSGVGKSSLINSVNPGLDLKVGDISDTHSQGKHTTTFAEMHALDFGGYIIDTPGIRSFGLIEVEKKEELSHFFPEIFKVGADCRFHNCTHSHEPGCAVKGAVENNEIPFTRYENYLAILEGNDNNKYREDIYAE